MTDSPPRPDDPFLADDPAAQERERRRLEREARRREREARRREAEARAGRVGSQPSRDGGGRDGASQPAPPPERRHRPRTGPSVGERLGSALHGAGGRLRADGEGVGSRLSGLRPPSLGGVFRPKRGMAALAVALPLVAMAWLLVALFQPFHGGGEGQVVVTVPQGANAGDVAELLDEKGVISSATLFELRLTLAGRRSDLFAGDYALERGMSYSEVMDALSSPPSQRTLAITVPEGYSREQIAKLATDAGLRGSYEKASRSSKKLDLSRYGAGSADSLEGFLFPATYELKPGSRAKDLVDEQVSAFEEQIKRVDLGYAKSKNLSVYDLLIIASMIDREVMVASERRLVAAVIYNRLSTGEPLGIDATIRYATGNYDKPLTESELAIDSPYNTRTNAGLPPTPIGNPGFKSIQAAANPKRVDYRYYVVKPGTCGEHEFVETQAEFDAAVERYNTAREAAGGKSPTSCPDE